MNQLILPTETPSEPPQPAVVAPVLNAKSPTEEQPPVISTSNTQTETQGLFEPPRPSAVVSSHNTESLTEDSEQPSVVNTGRSMSTENPFDPASLNKAMNDSHATTNIDIVSNTRMTDALDGQEGSEGSVECHGPETEPRPNKCHSGACSLCCISIE